MTGGVCQNVEKERKQYGLCQKKYGGIQTMLCISFIIKYFFDNGNVVGDVNAMIGAMMLGYPIVWTAIKDLSKGRLLSLIHISEPTRPY